jgi:hypothetical protein
MAGFQTSTEVRSPRKVPVVRADQRTAPSNILGRFRA